MSTEEIGSLNVKINLDGTGFQNGVTAINRQMRVVQTEFEAAAAKVGGFGGSVEGLQLKAESLTRQMGLQQQKVEALQKAFEQSVEQKGRDAKQTQDLEVKLNRARTALANMENELRSTNDSIQEHTRESEQLSGHLSQASHSSDGFSKALGILNAVMATVGIVEFAHNLTDMAFSFDSASRKLQVQTGLTADETKSLGVVAESVYKDAFAGSVDEAFESVGALENRLGEMADEELRFVAEGASMLKDNFGPSLDEVAKVVKGLSSNFKDLSYSQAMDIITTGFQQGADYAGDFLDTVNEYSAHFSKLGLSAREFLTILEEGKDQGAFNLDKIGDSVKEFGIRAQDGSKSTAEGFAAIGLNADKMAKQIAAGGETAKKAFLETIQGLKNMKDPVAQNIAGVNLFGSMWEDLGPKVILSMDTIKVSVTKTEGATKQAMDTMTQSVGTKWESIKRTITSTLAGEGSPLVQWLTTSADYLNAHMPEIQSAIQHGSEAVISAFQAIGQAGAFVAQHLDVILPLLGGLGVAFAADKIMDGVKAIQEAGGAIKFVGEIMKTTFLANPWALAIGAIAIAAYEIYEHWDQIKDFLAKTWQWIKETAVSVWNGITQFFVEWGPTILAVLTGGVGLLVKFVYDHWDQVKQATIAVWNAISGFLKSVWDGIVSVATTVWNSISGVFRTVWGAVEPIVSGVWDSIKTYFTAGFEAIKVAVSTGWDVIVTAWNAAKDTVVAIVSGIWETIKTIFATTFLVIYDIVTGKWDQIGGVFAAAREKLNGIIGDMWNKIKNIFTNAFDSIREKVSTGWDTIKSIWTTAFNAISSNVSAVWGYIKERFNESLENLKNGIHTAWTNISNACSSGIKAVADFFVNGWHSIVQGVQDAWNQFCNRTSEGMTRARQSITSIWDGVLNWFKGLPGQLQEWGHNTVEGFVNGITGAADWAIGKIKEFFVDVLSWAKKILGIASPSKVMKQFGAWTAEGFAIGIADNKDKAVSQAQIMAQAVSDAVSKSLNDINLDVQISQSEFDVFAKQIGTTTVDAAEKLKAQTELLNIELAASNDRLSVLWDAYDRMKAVKGEDAEETRKLYLEILKEQSAQADLQKQLQDTADAQEAQAKQVLDMQKKVADATDKYAKDSAAVYQEYRQKVEAEQKKLADGEAKLTETYQKAVEDRAKALYGSFGLFDQVKPDANVSGADLLNNLQGQVDAFDDWQQNITALSKRGIDSGLIAELQQAGPKAGAQIAALNTLSDDQLKKYVALWQTKNREAREQAEKEMQPLKQDTQRQIDDLRKQTAIQLDQYKQDWMNKQAQLQAELSASYTSILGDAKQFGGDFVQSINDAINARMDSLRGTFGKLKQMITSLKGDVSAAISATFPTTGVGVGGVFGGFNIPGLATGGTVMSPGLTWVGERGPELLNLPRGSQVIPLDRAVGGGQQVAVTLQFMQQAPIYGVDDLELTLTNFMRTKAVPILNDSLRQPARARR